jgi:hypothetical protein
MGLRQSTRYPCPHTRREFLRAGALALGGLTLSDVLRARAVTGTSSLDTSVILFYMWGGPSHLETYDLKPDAPIEYRSVFRPIATRVPGMEICELFPRQAQIADRFSLVRSLHHEINIHNDAAIEVLTGKRPSRLDPTSQAVSEHPDFAMITSRDRARSGPAMPRYVAIPNALHMTRPTYLGVEHGPFVAGNPAGDDYSAPHLKLAAGLNAAKLSDRQSLISQLDRMRRGLDQHAALEATDKFREQAFRLLASPDVADAFDVGRETDATRDRYGRNEWGQACLLARRLAEADTAVVTIYANTPKNGPEFTNWDDHPDNAGRPGHFGDYMRTRLPCMDQALAALIEDIYGRGLDHKVLLVAVGEFGRTPKISYRSATGSTGRDHWPQAYSALISGGGLRMGQVIGATNSKGEYPTERSLTPQDLLATMYRHLGIESRQSFNDFSGRPIPILSDGEPIRELI